METFQMLREINLLSKPTFAYMTPEIMAQVEVVPMSEVAGLVVSPPAES
jgi:hypothetical protein